MPLRIIVPSDVLYVYHNVKWIRSTTEVDVPLLIYINDYHQERYRNWVADTSLLNDLSVYYLKLCRRLVAEISHWCSVYFSFRITYHYPQILNDPINGTEVWSQQKVHHGTPFWAGSLQPTKPGSCVSDLPPWHSPYHFSGGSVPVNKTQTILMSLI